MTHDLAQPAGERSAIVEGRLSLPAARPCGSCPYRTDVPSGVWHPDEYAKLAAYDRPTFEQPPNLFACHQQDGRLCAGWVACHDMGENLALRFAAIAGDLSVEEAEQVRDYTTPVPLFTSGAEAAAHGLREVADPGPAATKTVAKLTRRRARTN